MTPWHLERSAPSLTSSERFPSSRDTSAPSHIYSSMFAGPNQVSHVSKPVGSHFPSSKHFSTASNLCSLLRKPMWLCKNKMLCISQPVPKLYPFQRGLGFQNYYFLRAHEIHLSRKQTAHSDFRFCFCLLEFDMFQSLESDKIAKGESNSTLQLSSDHEGTPYHHFSLSLVEIIRNSKCFYLQILGNLCPHFLSKYHFETRFTLTYMLEFCNSTITHYAGNLLCSVILVFSEVWQSCWTGRFGKTPIAQVIRTRRYQTIQVWSGGVFSPPLLFFLRNEMLTLTLILNIASQTVRQLGKTRSTVSATYMCSHVATICSAVPEVSSSDHKKHCHIKHPADTDYGVRNQPASCWAIRLRPHKRISKEPWKDHPSRAFPSLLSPAVGFPPVMRLLLLTPQLFSKCIKFYKPASSQLSPTAWVGKNEFMWRQRQEK